MNHLKLLKKGEWLVSIHCVLVVFILQENKEEVDDISYTLKEINAIGGKTNYNVVAICIPDNMHIVKAAWEKAFDWSEYLFIADKSYTNRGNQAYSQLGSYIIMAKHLANK